MKYIHSIFSVIIAALLFAGCDLTPDVAPVPTYDGPAANTTIAELIAMHEIGSLDSYIHLSEDSADIVISGIVTTSDKHGNCYKYINIEDGTGGIQIKINNTALHNKYRVGQRVYVKCNGLDLGDYRKLPQLGYWANDAMQPIPSAKAGQYIFCDGVPEAFEPQIVLTSIPSADAISPTWYNRLVKLENCYFVEGGMATYCDANSATSRDIKMADGTTITMRTSNYADFINETLPTGNGNVVGILTRYNSTVQIVIRDLDDVQEFVAPPHTENLLTVNYTNAFNEGWLQSGTGAEWSVFNNTSFTGFYINANNTATDNWLISPNVNLSSVEAPLLSFSHRISGTGGNETMKLYYTTNFTGDATTTEWHEIPIPAFSSSTLIDFSQLLPADAIAPNFRFAFRYNGSGNAWYINNIDLKGIVR